MKCCDTCYSICEPLISCFETLLVYLPIGYAEETVKIRISNGQNHVTYQTSEVIGGTHIQIDLDNTLIPQGFFSGFGGPYQIEFFGIDLNQLTFVAIDGKTYNCITFQVVNGSTDETVAIVNAFYTTIPPEDMNTNINYVAIAINEQQNQSDELTFLLALQNS